MRRWMRDNSLSLVIFSLFAVFLLVQTLAGHAHYNDERQDHDQAPVALSDYVRSGSFLEATMENWESEFLQMAAFMLLTAFLYQRGSGESKNPDKREPRESDTRVAQRKRDAPWPVRHGGVALRLYEHSLSIAFLVLFAVSFALHALGGAQAYNEEQAAHGGETISVTQYVATSQFWFESMQNWQSEFFALGAMVVLSIFLRERGSPESKPVDSPHSATGHD